MDLSVSDRNMPKSKEFIESSDSDEKNQSDSDEETPKKSKAKIKDDVSSID
jgi:hypothetical protein